MTQSGKAGYTGELESARAHLESAVQALARAAAATAPPGAPATSSYSDYYNGVEVPTPPAAPPAGAEHHDDIALLGDEVLDLYTRVGALHARITLVSAATGSA